MKKLHIGTSQLTGTIFAGTLLKDQRTWASNKQDVTLDALVAVAEHGIKFGKPIQITDAESVPLYRITVVCEF